jgi:ATP-dependent protease ClpP protease subunit
MGGELSPALKFLTIFKDSKVPICTIVDNYSCSAATILSVNSPYCLMTDYSLTLIHQYHFEIKANRETFLNNLKITESTEYSKMQEMYLHLLTFKMSDYLRIK